MIAGPAAIRLGEAAAGIVFVTDVRAAGDAATGVAIPDAPDVVGDYPIAILAAARSPDAARRFVDFVQSAAGRSVLDHLGFQRPDRAVDRRPARARRGSTDSVGPFCKTEQLT
jgi:ABC-type molybdate transport system substrate-binding protein